MKYILGAVIAILCSFTCTDLPLCFAAEYYRSSVMVFQKFSATNIHNENSRYEFGTRWYESRTNLPKGVRPRGNPPIALHLYNN